MDLAGIHPDDYEAAQKREERRCQLVDAVKGRDKAEGIFKSAQRKVYAAEEAEVARRKKAVLGITALKKKASTAHEGLEYSAECEGVLRAVFVDQELTSKRDSARAASSRAGRRLHNAQMDLLTLTRIVGRKDPKKVSGVLRDKDGNPRRQKPSPDDVSALPPVMHGMINNPNKWTSRDQRAQFMESVTAREVACSECELRAVAAEKIYAAAETALSIAYEEVLNAG